MSHQFVADQLFNLSPHLTTKNLTNEKPDNPYIRIINVKKT